MTQPTPMQVGIGLVGRDGYYLIRQRPEGSVMAGLWEFPGGKVEPGESPAEATARECFEEVGILVKVDRLDRRVIHQYPHGLVELSYYHVRLTEPAAEPAPDTGFRWVWAGDLPTYTFPPANDPVIADLAASVG